MLVRFRVPVADGEGRRYASGQTAQVDDTLARTWVGLGFAESAESEKRTAVRKAPRKATKK